MRYTMILALCLMGVFVMVTAGFAQPTSPDYGEALSWVSRPDAADKPVDVFYVYPTIYMDKEPGNMDISREDLRGNAEGLMVAQAGVYSSYANLFAPFYRQQSGASQSMEPGNGGRDAFADPLFMTGYSDVERVFDHYIENLNPDRPFILAGHSQGSMVIVELMRRRMGDPELQKRLIAAYIIGYTVKKDDLDRFPQMKLAQGETDTGVIITYNTQGPGAEGSPVLLSDAVAINPLNWSTDGTPAGREENLKAIFFNDSTGEVVEEITHFCGAYVDLETGALIATDIQMPQKVDLVNMGRWPKEIYHRFDYAFFYDNLKANVKKRIDSYLACQKR